MGVSISGDVSHPRPVIIKIAPNICQFCADISKILSRLLPKIIKLLPKRFQLLIRRRKLILCRHLPPDIGKIIFRRHVFDDVSEHVPDFFERRFFCGHT